jgi:hypothetical protein
MTQPAQPPRLRLDFYQTAVLMSRCKRTAGSSPTLSPSTMWSAPARTSGWERLAAA